MNTSKSLNFRFSALLLITVGLALTRLFNASCATPLANFTPIGSMALFGGHYFSEKWKAYLLPLMTLWISDLFLNYFVYYHKLVFFYDGFYWTYGAFALATLIGSLIKKVNFRNVIMAAVAAALVHWIITDFGVWMEGRLYPKTATGLIACYVAAIPYMKNMLAGNLLFSAISFGLFEWAQQKYPRLQLISVQ
ncbi:hypothetical protein FHW36_10994 [Chitinophaga polysaccharea]|uniref:Uncharacterized protein n=1 Tax=Chitinophaga polysaccharea TaxID=1293035 RepID=A0A561PB02_9BACT|nr:DUF6580 family putative transport protein [Chitinophaga polysaccharea]TWF35305.1 hypothetical protein FHW36_10994 [Chitinophaga polysaccharea]